MIEGLNVEIIGEKELQKALDRGVKQAVRTFLRARLKEPVQNILIPAMEEKAPKDKGNLATHINLSVKFKDGDTHVEIEVGPEDVAFYGGLQETGTRFEKPQPWMRPALEETQEELVAGIEEALDLSFIEEFGE